MIVLGKMVRNAAAAAVATFGGLALGVASEADHSGFHVVSPSEGMAVLADRYALIFVSAFWVLSTSSRDRDTGCCKIVCVLE